jgi:hypothetical protein
MKWGEVGGRSERLVVLWVVCGTRRFLELMERREVGEMRTVCGRFCEVMVVGGLWDKEFRFVGVEVGGGLWNEESLWEVCVRS